MLRAELDVVRTDYNGVRLHAGIGYVTPNDEHEGRGPASARPAKPGSKRPAYAASPTIASTAAATRTGDPAMLANRTAISIANSETGHPAVPGGFDLDDFDIDDAAHTVTCPAGVVAALSARAGPASDPTARRARCARAPRPVTDASSSFIRNTAVSLPPGPKARTDEFEVVYRRWRPMVERSLAWLTRGSNRKLRYRGVDRNRPWWSHRCAAVNLRRLLNLGIVIDTNGGWAIA